MSRWALGGLLLICAAGVASADWLVMNDGTRIETAGAWAVEGKRIVFHLPNGTLSAVRKSEVDLDASAVATAEASSAAAETPTAEEPETIARATTKERREPVLVVTDADVARATVATDDGDPADGEGDEPKLRPNVPKLDVIGWRSAETRDGQGLEVMGTLRNSGTGTAGGVRLEVTINEPNYGELSASAFLDRQALGGNSSTRFRAVFPRAVTIEGEPAFEIGFITLGGQREDADASPAEPEPTAEAPAG